MARINITVFLLFFIYSVFAQANTVKGIRLWPGQNNTRIVLEIEVEAKAPKISKGLAKSSKPTNLEYTNFTLENPNRLVLDIKNTSLANPQVAKNISFDNTQISSLRYSKQNNNLRLVFDLKKQAAVKLFTIPPVTTITSHRLVVDVKNKIVADQVISNSPTWFPEDKTQAAIFKQTNKLKNTETKDTPLPRLSSINNSARKKFTVVIDPGHGGDDPGAIGQSGTREKDVALSVAYYLKRYIDQDEELRAVLTRTGDYYIGLRERTEKARANQADLFVSIHADGFRDTRASGSSVWVLSERGATSEMAKWLAAHENASDLVGGVRLENKDPMLTTVLLDLSQTASNRASYQVANKVLQQMAVITDLHKSSVEKAAFMVLRSPDIPSILVETGFISNPRGERDLLSSVHQKKIAFGIYKGVKSYFKMYPRPSWSDEMIQARK